MWTYAEAKPQDRIKIRCEKSSDEDLFQVGKIYDGAWVRMINETGHERIKNRYYKFDEHGESFNTYREPWFKFTIVEGLTEPPKE